MNEAMAPVVGALHEQQAELATFVADASEEALRRPSRCEGWSVADVLLHLAQTNEAAVASLAGALADEGGAGFWVEARTDATTVDGLAGAMVEAERDAPGTVRDRWRRSADAQEQAFAAADPHAQVPWVVGTLAARTLATTRLTECWIHTGDVAVAFDGPPPPTDRLWHTARLVHRTVPYAFQQGSHVPAGEVAFVLDAPSGETWTFGDPEAAPTAVRGSAAELCELAGQRASAAETALRATGPDGAAVLRLARTFA